MNFDIVFSSSDTAKDVQIASGHISETLIFFEDVQVYARVHAKGSVAFFDLNEALLSEITVPVAEGGREVYETLRLSIEDGCPTLAFPICEWIDNYPHCDGEHDRWDTKIVGYHTVRFDVATGSLQIFA